MIKIFLVAFLLILLITSCGINPISKLKKGRVLFWGQYIPIQQIEDGLAGATGSVKWTSFKSDDIKNPNVRIVQMTVTKKDKETALVQFLYNEKRDIHELGYIELDGEPSNPLTLSAAIMFSGTE